MPGDTLGVVYTGWLENPDGSRGPIFDSNIKSPELFRFVLGQGAVIKGWDVGLIGMRKEGTRALRVPPHLAYGANPPNDGKIPPNAALHFEVSLKRMKKGPAHLQAAASSGTLSASSSAPAAAEAGTPAASTASSAPATPMQAPVAPTTPTPAAPSAPPAASVTAPAPGTLPPSPLPAAAATTSASAPAADVPLQEQVWRGRQVENTAINRGNRQEEEKANAELCAERRLRWWASPRTNVSQSTCYGTVSSSPFPLPRRASGPRGLSGPCPSQWPVTPESLGRALDRGGSSE